jgi:nicotinamide mononucleotide transporter
MEQIYYLVVSVYGWWRWSRQGPDPEKPLEVHYSSAGSAAATLAVTAVLSAAFGALLVRAHEVFPVLFPEPASYPYLDALTTVMSFTAMWLMARGRVESWLYWIVVDVIGIGLYHVKSVQFVALLYVVLLAMAVWGFQSWHRARQR